MTRGNILRISNREEALTGVLATDGGLVADGGDPGSAVTVSVRLVEVDLEAVHLAADPVVVVEL